MSAKTTVSVVIPAFNAAGAIAAALSSVAAQTRPPAEVVVVDDASTDNTADVARSGSSNHRIIQSPCNLGPAAARNRGVAEARGEWIAFLDADDAWLPGRLAPQLACAAEYPEVAFFCGDTVALEDGTPNGKRESPRLAVHSPPSIVLRLQDLAIRNCVATSTVLVKKASILGAGGFDEQFRGPEDFDLWLRILAQDSARKLDCPLSRYRHVQGSLSMDDRKFLPEVLRVLDKAYRSGGALSSIPARRRAVAFQYLCAAWMAAERRAVGRAWALYIKGLAIWPGTFRPYLDLPWQRAKLFVGLARRLAKP